MFKKIKEKKVISKENIETSDYKENSEIENELEGLSKNKEIFIGEIESKIMK